MRQGEGNEDARARADKPHQTSTKKEYSEKEEWNKEEAGGWCQGWETSGPRAIKCEPGPKLTNRTSTSRQREM